MRLSLKLLWVGFILAGCGARPPQGELLVYITTDAPLPPPFGSALEPSEAPPLFDRVRLDAYEPGAAESCAGCVHEFALDRALVEEGRASFGLLPPPGVNGYRLRLRMFMSVRRTSAEPPPDATIELWLELPPVAEEGVVELTAFLPTDAVGTAIGSADSPRSPIMGSPPPGLVGTWWGSQRIECGGVPRSGEVCVPGGAFWMGNPRARSPLFESVEQQRLVVVAPFYLDATEVSVAALRASGVAALGDPDLWAGGNGETLGDLCNYTDQPGAFEELPANCASWSKAREYCQARGDGSDLPTEAQFEYAAGALRGSLYVWGMDEPTCEDAVFGRGWGVHGLPIVAPCRQADGRPLPVSRAEHGRDVLVLPSGEIYDLAGNIAEWTFDVFEPEGAECWPTGVLENPRCEPPDAPWDAERTFRGGSWAALPAQLRAASRSGAPFDALPEDAGFRCARPGL